MFLELHDSEVGNTLAGAIHLLDYEYQAEQHVIELATEHPEIVQCILFTQTGEPLRAWKRGQKNFEDCPIPAGTRADYRTLKTASEYRDQPAV